jgi:hypothetical protein
METKWTFEIISQDMKVFRCGNVMPVPSADIESFIRSRRCQPLSYKVLKDTAGICNDDAAGGTPTPVNDADSF